MESSYSRKFFWLTLAPGLVLALCGGTFAWLSRALLAYDRLERPALPFDPLQELPSGFVAATYGYGIALVLIVLIAVPTLIYCLWLLARPALPGGRDARKAALAVSAILVLLVLLRLGGFDTPEVEFLYAATVDKLAAKSGGMTPGEWIRLVTSANRLVWFPTIAFLILAAAAVISVPRGKSRLEAGELTQRMAWLRMLLYLGAALLIAGLIGTRALMEVPASLFPDDPELPVPRVIGDLSLAVQLFLGSSMTFLLVAIYVPPAVILRGEAQRLARQKVGEEEAENVESWLGQQGLVSGGFSQLVQVAAMLGPLLAGPVASFLGPLVSGLTGS